MGRSRPLAFLRWFWPCWACGFSTFGLWLVLAHPSQHFTIALTFGFTVPVSVVWTIILWTVGRDW